MRRLLQPARFFGIINVYAVGHTAEYVIYISIAGPILTERMLSCSESYGN